MVPYGNLHPMAENYIRPRPLHLKALALGKIIHRQMPFLTEPEAITRALIHYAKQRVQ